jgi:hypothetical protein
MRITLTQAVVNGTLRPSFPYIKAITILFACFFCASISLIVWGSNKGFDLTDEGFYMLLVSHPDQYPSNWTGFQFLVSSVQHLIHPSILVVRILRLSSILLANVFFAIAFLVWLNSCCLNKSKSQIRYQPFLFLLLLSSTLMPYTLLPQAPGYNDLAGLSSLLVAACILLAIRPTDSPYRMISRSAFIGLSAFFLVFATFGKWSSGLALLLLLALVMPLSLPDRSRRGDAMHALAFVGGLLFGLATVHFSLLDLRIFFQWLGSAISEAAGNDHPPLRIFQSYAKELINLLLNPLKYGWWGVVLTVLLASRTTGFQTKKSLWLDNAIFAGILVNLAYYAVHKDLFLGSNAYMQTSVRVYALIAILLLAFLATHRLMFRGTSGDMISTGSEASHVVECPQDLSRLSGPLLLLFFLPLSVAAGTVGSLFSVAVYVFACWIGLLVILALNIRPFRWGGVLSGALLSITLGLMESQFIHGYLLHPYGLLSPLFQQVERVDDLPIGSELGFDSKTASFLSEITRMYQAAGPAVNQPVIALFDLPGLVYLLGAVSPGTAWYSDAAGAGSVEHIPALGTTSNTNSTQPTNPKPFLFLPEILTTEVQRVLLNRLAFPEDYQLAGTARSPYNGNLLSLWIPAEPPRYEAQFQKP